MGNKIRKSLSFDISVSRLLLGVSNIIMTNDSRQRKWLTRGGVKNRIEEAGWDIYLSLISIAHLRSVFITFISRVKLKLMDENTSVNFLQILRTSSSCRVCLNESIFDVVKNW